MSNNTIGDNIRAARLAKGMTQEKLGAAAGGRSVNQINGYERGRSRPSAPVLADIAKALDVTPDSLLGKSAVASGASELSATDRSFVELFKKRCAASLGVPVEAVRITIEVVQ